MAIAQLIAPVALTITRSIAPPVARTITLVNCPPSCIHQVNCLCNYRQLTWVITWAILWVIKLITHQLNRPLNCPCNCSGQLPGQIAGQFPGYWPGIGGSFLRSHLGRPFFFGSFYWASYFGRYLTLTLRLNSAKKLWSPRLWICWVHFVITSLLFSERMSM